MAWKFRLATIVTLFTALSCSPKDGLSMHAEEVNGIREAVMNYINGWYNGDSEMEARSLHDDFIKRIPIGADSRGCTLYELNKAGMTAAAGEGGGKDVPKDKYDIQVRILDISENIASAMVLSEYIDYIHLAKINNRWQLINVLWDHVRNR